MLPLGLRLQKNSDFKKVYRRGQKIEGRELVLYYTHNRLNAVRFGFSISRKVGKATRRNRYKRILREVCFKYRKLLRPGFDIVIVVKEIKDKINYAPVEDEVLKLAARAKLFLKIDKVNKYDQFNSITN